MADLLKGQTMHYRQLGKHALRVSEISMGSNRLGQSVMTEQEGLDLVARAIELGVNLFDTAESYGEWGGSESILGQALVDHPEIMVATKVSRNQKTGEKRFDAKLVVDHAEGSLRRLQRDRIDILQLHSPSLEMLQELDWAEGMRKLKEQGKIRLTGVSINDAESGIWLIENGLADVLQVRYSILEPEVGEKVFPLAAAHGVGILVRMPMCRGILTGKYASQNDVSENNRARLMRDELPALIERANRYLPLAERAGIPMSQYALRYSISPTGVSAAIPGARTIDQLEQNVAASNGIGLPPDDLQAIATIQTRWDKQ